MNEAEYTSQWAVSDLGTIDPLGCGYVHSLSQFELSPKIYAHNSTTDNQISIRYMLFIHDASLFQEST